MVMRHLTRYMIAQRLVRANVIEQLMREMDGSSRSQIRNHISLRALVLLLQLSMDSPQRNKAGRALDPILSGALRFMTPSKINQLMRGLGAPQRMIDEVVAKRQILMRSGKWPTWREQRNSTEGVIPAPDGPGELDWWDQLDTARKRVRELRLKRQQRMM